MRRRRLVMAAVALATAVAGIVFVRVLLPHLPAEPLDIQVYGQPTDGYFPPGKVAHRELLSLVDRTALFPPDRAAYVVAIIFALLTVWWSCLLAARTSGQTAALLTLAWLLTSPLLLLMICGGATHQLPGMLFLILAAGYWCRGRTAGALTAAAAAIVFSSATYLGAGYIAISSMVSVRQQLPCPWRHLLPAVLLAGVLALLFVAPRQFNDQVFYLTETFTEGHQHTGFVSLPFWALLTEQLEGQFRSVLFICLFVAGVFAARRRTALRRLLTFAICMYFGALVCQVPKTARVFSVIYPVFCIGAAAGTAHLLVWIRPRVLRRTLLLLLFSAAALPGIVGLYALHPALTSVVPLSRDCRELGVRRLIYPGSTELLPVPDGITIEPVPVSAFTTLASDSATYLLTDRYALLFALHEPPSLAHLHRLDWYAALPAVRTYPGLCSTAYRLFHWEVITNLWWRGLLVPAPQERIKLVRWSDVLAGTPPTMLPPPPR